MKQEEFLPYELRLCDDSSLRDASDTDKEVEKHTIPDKEEIVKKIDDLQQKIAAEQSKTRPDYIRILIWQREIVSIKQDLLNYNFKQIKVKGRQ